jgi:hypothetical protein
MNIIHRTRERALLSVTSAELDAIEQALAASTSSAAAQECLTRLREDLRSRPVSAEHAILNVWADGASVRSGRSRCTPTRLTWGARKLATFRNEYWTVPPKPTDEGTGPLSCLPIEG